MKNKQEPLSTLADVKFLYPPRDIPYGYCRCGCGLKTSIATKTYSGNGIRKGEPLKCYPGHGSRRALVERFWEKVDTSAGPDKCWPWQHAKGKGIHGVFLIYPGRSSQAHRVSYILKYGYIAPDQLACHRCNNPECVNPAHIYAGTKSTNALDYTATSGYRPSKVLYLTFNGQVRSVKEWSAITGLSVVAIKSRLLRGWSAEDALTVPRIVGAPKINRGHRYVRKADRDGWNCAHAAGRV